MKLEAACTVVFAPSETVFQLHQKMCIKTWTTALSIINTVALKLYVTKKQHFTLSLENFFS